MKDSESLFFPVHSNSGQWLQVPQGKTGVYKGSDLKDSKPLLHSQLPGLGIVSNLRIRVVALYGETLLSNLEFFSSTSQGPQQTIYFILQISMIPLDSTKVFCGSPFFDHCSCWGVCYNNTPTLPLECACCTSPLSPWQLRVTMAMKKPVSVVAPSAYRGQLWHFDTCPMYSSSLTGKTPLESILKHIP